MKKLVLLHDKHLENTGSLQVCHTLYRRLPDIPDALTVHGSDETYL